MLPEGVFLPTNAMTTNRTDVQSPRPASTVVLGRADADGLPQLLFLKRPASMRFLAGFHAFPGGALSEQDYDPLAIEASVLTADEAGSFLGEDAAGLEPLGFYVCALRELFEEVGVLLAVDGDTDVTLTSDQIEIHRRRLLTEQATIGQVMADLGLKLATHKIRFHHRWIAPEGLPRRYDVRVFVGAFSGDTIPHDEEVDAVDWHTPGEILGLAEMGSVLLAPPTVATVMSMSRYSNVADLVSGNEPAAQDHEIELVGRSVRRLVAPNASLMTGPGSNTYLIGDDKLIVVDPGSMEPDHLRKIAAAGSVELIVITHGHPDHFSGALDLAEMTGAEVAASSRFWERAALSDKGRRLNDGDSIVVNDIVLQVLVTPGHSSDHICLWLERDKALFSGDLVLGFGTTVISPPDGNLIDYMASLRKVAALGAVKLFPGHFDPRDDASSWIDFYISHRLQREEQIVRCLKNGPRDAAGIVEQVYSDTPAALHRIAERSVLAHLEKLIAEGAVARDGDGFGLL